VPRPVPRIALFARYPTPGAAKTRLIPALGEDGAAALHRKLVELTLSAVRSSGLPYELRVTGAPSEAFAAWLGADVPLAPQGDGDLGERLARVEAPMLLIGSDCPDLMPMHLVTAAKALETSAAVLGPAGDGGYWLLGLARAMPQCFVAMPWGTATVATETRVRLAAAGITPTELETLHDCDRPEDLARWPWLTW
jgi:rSAM/selenodomain-associated transferase 1